MSDLPPRTDVPRLAARQRRISVARGGEARLPDGAPAALRADAVTSRTQDLRALVSRLRPSATATAPTAAEPDADRRGEDTRESGTDLAEDLAMVRAIIAASAPLPARKMGDDTAPGAAEAVMADADRGSLRPRRITKARRIPGDAQAQGDGALSEGGYAAPGLHRSALPRQVTTPALAPNLTCPIQTSLHAARAALYGADPDAPPKAVAQPTPAKPRAMSRVTRRRLSLGGMAQGLRLLAIGTALAVGLGLIDLPPALTSLPPHLHSGLLMLLPF